MRNEGDGSPLRAVFFDLGETLVDETRQWSAWADRVGVPRLTLFALLGAVIERGQDHRTVFDLLSTGMDPEGGTGAKEATTIPWDIRPEDLYPDARPCLEALRAEGYRLGVAGNQPRRTEASVSELGLPVDLVLSSDTLGAAKPAREFFEELARRAGVAPEESAYVGDRLDNDVLPARDAGMLGVFLRRGPWGLLHAGRPEAAHADLRIDSLNELPLALRARRRSPRHPGFGSAPPAPPPASGPERTGGPRDG